MSYQVGLFCYATPVEAGQASCASFSPVSNVTQGGDVVSVSCASVNADTGALQLQVATTPLSGVTSYQTVEQLPAFPPCQQGELIDALMSIFWAAVLVLGVPYVAFKIYQRLLDFRNFHRGN